eukprot:580370-Amphidinium_carterae.1
MGPLMIYHKTAYDLPCISTSARFIATWTAYDLPQTAYDDDDDDDDNDDDNDDLPTDFFGLNAVIHQDIGGPTGKKPQQPATTASHQEPTTSNNSQQQQQKPIDEIRGACAPFYR